MGWKRGCGVVLAVAFGLLLEARPARAGNTDETLIGNDAALMGGAQTASGTSMAYNVAGLAAAENDSVDVSLSAYSLRLHSVSNLVAGEAGAAEGGSAMEISIIPTSVAFIREMNDRLTFGLGVFTLEQSNFSADGDATVADTANQMTYRLRVDREKTLLKAMIGLGWQPTDYFSMGFSVDVYYSTFRLSYLNDVSRTAVGTEDVTGGESYASDSSFDDFGLGASIGARLDMGDHVVLGVSATLPSFSIGVAYNLSQSWTFFPGDAGEGCTPDNSACHTASADSGFQTSVAKMTPARVRVGLAWVDSTFRLEADFDMQGAGTDSSGHPRSPTWNLRVGGMLDLNPELTLGAGFFTDRSALRETVIPGDRIQDFYGLSVGIIMRKTLRLAEEEEDDALVFTTAIGLRYAYGTGQILGLRVDPSVQPGAEFPTQLTSLRTHEIALNMGSGVSF